LSTATGELALEQFLSTIRQQWINFELIIIIRDGIKIISGWDILFITLEDNLNSISSMKSSPYYRNVHEFQEESINWEQKLTNLRTIFEIWVEVQRKWLYLRNIFKNNDIKQQLQSQYSKFKSIDNEYLNILKRCIAKPSVLELLQYDNLHRQLERQDNTMTLIQKALGMIVTMMLMMMIIIIINIIMFYLMFSFILTISVDIDHIKLKCYLSIFHFHL
jgi:dynein heavy chain 1